MKKRIALDYNLSIDWLISLTDVRNYTADPNITIALHSDYDALPKEATNKINIFVEYTKPNMKIKNKVFLRTPLDIYHVYYTFLYLMIFYPKY